MNKLVSQMKVGCNIGGAMINLLCFALTHEFGGTCLECSHDTLYISANKINMKFSAKKTVYMVLTLLFQEKLSVITFLHSLLETIS